MMCLSLGNNLSKINKVKYSLHTQFFIKDIGETKFFLGLEIA